MTAMWTDTIMYQTANPGMRGLGGRFHFFGEDDKQAVRVDGALTIYAFDARGGAGAHKPEKKFVFLPDQLDEHRSDSTLGASYSFWLPWDEVGGPQRTLSLIARFESNDGKIVISTPTKVVLPGVETSRISGRVTSGSSPAAAVQAQPYPARQVAFQGDTAAEQAPAEDDRTFTIEVPPQFLRHTRGQKPALVDQMGEDRQQVITGTSPAAHAALPTPVTDAQPGAMTVSEPAAGQAESLDESQARSEPARYQARIEPRARQSADRVRRQPHRVTWPYRPGRSPQSDPAGSGSR
jgi:hypothetical protein